MENDSIDFFGLWTKRTEPPEHFPNTDLWKQFIDTYKSCGLKSDKFRDEKKRIEKILQDRYLDLRGKHTDEEANAKDDLVVWLTCYPWSLAVIYLRFKLDQEEKSCFGQDALQNASINIGPYLEKYEPGKAQLDTWLTKYCLPQTITETRTREKSGSEEEANKAIKYGRLVARSKGTHNRDPESDQELLEFSDIKKESTIKDYREAWEFSTKTISLDGGRNDDNDDDHDMNPVEEYVRPLYEGSSEQDDQVLMLIEEIVEKEFSEKEQAVYFGTMKNKPDRQIFQENEGLIASEDYVRKIRERYIKKLIKLIEKKVEDGWS